MAYTPIDPTVLTGVLNNQGTQATSANQTTAISLAQNGTATATVVMNDMGTLATALGQSNANASLTSIVNNTGTLATSAKQDSQISALSSVVNNQGSLATTANQATAISLAQNGTATATVMMNNQGTQATAANQATSNTTLAQIMNNQGTLTPTVGATSANQLTQIALAQNGTSALTVIMNNEGTLATAANQITEIAALSALVSSQGTARPTALWGTGEWNGTDANFQQVQVNQGRMQVDVSITDPKNLDAFSRLRTSHPAYRFDGQFTYQFNTDTWDATSTSGSIAYDSVNRMVTLANDAGTNVTVLQSHYYAPYTPGRSQLALATFNMKTAPTAGQTKRVGYFDGNNGLFVEWDATNGVSVNCISDTAAGSEKILQANWNIDPLNGLGPSGFTLDLTKTQIFFISMQALYVGRVIVGFDIDGNLVPVHAFLHANRIVAPYIQQAAQPIRYELRGTNSVGSRMDAICASVMSEGGEELLNMPGRAFSVSLAAGTGVTAEVPMLAIRPKQTLNGVRNQGLVLPQQVTAYSRTNGSRIRLIRNGTISPAVWVDVSTQNSMCEYSVSPTSVTGGETVYTAFCDQEGGVAFSLDSSSLGRILGAYSHVLTTNPADTFVLTAASVNATANVQVGINWKEIR